MVGINNIISKSVCFERTRVERNRLVSGKPYGCGTVFTVRSRIGKRIEVKRANRTILACAQTDANFHFMSGRACDLRFFSRIIDFCGSARFHRNESGVHFANSRLLCAETAANTRFFNTYTALGNTERTGKNTARVEYDLRRSNNVQSSVTIKLRISNKWFHHCLIEGFRMISSFKYDVTFFHNTVHVAVGGNLACDEISLGIAADLAGWEPILLGMNENGIVLCRMEIQNRFQNIIFYFNKLHCLERRFFVFSRNDCNGIACKTNVTVKDQSVIGRRLGKGLSRNSESCLGNIFPSVDIYDTGNFFCDFGFNFCHNCIRMRAAENFYDKSICRRYVIYIYGLAEQKLRSIFFTEGFSNRSVFSFVHFTPPFFLLSRYLRIPRS